MRQPTGQQLKAQALLAGGVAAVLLAGVVLHWSGFGWGVPLSLVTTILGLVASLKRPRPIRPSTPAAQERERAMREPSGSWEQVIIALLLGGLPLWLYLFFYFGGGCHQGPC